MNQDEVDLIYEYLHKHCGYVDGELIRKISSYGQPVGRKIGRMILEEKGRNGKLKPPCIYATITINKKKYNKKLSTFVYIFHNKKYELNLFFIDGNPLNTKIENLEPNSKKNLYKSRILDHAKGRFNNGITFVKEKNSYRGSTGLGGKRILVGYFKEKNKAIEAVKTIRNLYFEQNKDIEYLKEFIKENYHSVPVSGMKNIYQNRNRWGYKFMVNGKVHRKQIFNNAHEAHEAFLKAKKEHETT